VLDRKPNAYADAGRFWEELSTDSILSLTDSARSLAGNTPQCFTVLRLKLRHTNRETESLIGQKVCHPFWPPEQPIFPQKNAATNGPENKLVRG
jgi:hypothetical protein